MISSWVAHATREPSDLLLAGLDEWWTQAPMGSDPLRACPWLTSPFHRLMLVHVDRAAHKRRHLPTYVCKTDCELDDHGPSPIASLLRDDAYGPSPIQMRHAVRRTALGDAIELVKGQDSALSIAVVSEPDFEDPNSFDSHRSALVSPQRDGVALPIIHVSSTSKESLDAEIEREDLLRAAGWATYLVDLRKGEDNRQLHRRLASFMEDVFDEIAQIKADAAARVLMSEPLWPALVIRTSPDWRMEHAVSDDMMGGLGTAF